MDFIWLDIANQELVNLKANMRKLYKMQYTDEEMKNLK